MDPADTPALVVDATRVFRNIERLAAYANEHDLGVRPHTKTHKSRQPTLKPEHSLFKLPLPGRSHRTPPARFLPPRQETPGGTRPHQQGSRQ